MACAVTVEVASTGKNSSVGMADSEKDLHHFEIDTGGKTQPGATVTYPSPFRYAQTVAHKVQP